MSVAEVPVTVPFQVYVEAPEAVKLVGLSAHTVAEGGVTVMEGRL